MLREFRRVAIVNRGEAAMRFIHAVREYNQEYGTCIATIALFTEPDSHAMFVREADDSMCLGPAQVFDAATQQLKSSYVDYPRLRRALATARADAVWAGWGFVAEHAEFADLCDEIGVTFIGPTGDVMRLLGDKITSKRLAEKADIPVAPWGGGPVEELKEAYRQADVLGYPLLIKATAGGGGHGIRRVDSASQIAKAFESARAEAFKHFGNPTIFMETLVTAARHVEVQIIADHYGNTWAAGVRDCTIQRRHQKILEEAPPPALSPDQVEYLREAAVRLSRAAGYSNAGTVEFLYQPEKQLFSFLEMNTRLQVEHPVTECTTGLDLVKLQIHVARGGHLEGEAPPSFGHAIEVRLYAEDPGNAFAPAPGTIERFRIPSGPGVRLDTGAAEGDEVPAEFDSMIAKIIAHGRNRSEALARLQRVVRESVIVIKGGASNKPFLMNLLNRPEVQNGDVDVGWLDRLAALDNHVDRRYADVALVQAAVEVYVSELAAEQAQFYAFALRGRPQVRTEVGRKVELRYRGRSYSMKVYCLGTQEYRVESDGARVRARIDRLGKFDYWLTCFGRRHHVVSIAEGLNFCIEVEGVSHRVSRDDPGIVRSPSPAVVVSISVQPDDAVRAGDPVAVLEAMKMEMQIVAPFSGKVRQVMTMPYVQVGAGTPLLQIEPDAEDVESTSAERVSLARAADADTLREGSDSRCGGNLEELRQLMLGFDVDPAHTPRLVAEWTEHCDRPVESEEILKAEDELLEIFVDICSLFQREPGTNDTEGGEPPTAEAYLFSYLRMLETRGEGLPQAFVDALARTLAHYGVRTLDRSPELEESLLWIYKSHQRVERQITPIFGVLKRRLERVDRLASRVQPSFRTLLDRLISITANLSPALGDLAREVRYRYFDHPLFERARAQVYSEVDTHLHCLASNPDAADRLERIRALVECPQPLVNVFSRRFAEADVSLRYTMLEVLTSRYYRIRHLADFQYLAAGPHLYVSAGYEHEGKQIHVFATHTECAGLCETVRAAFPFFGDVPENEDIVVDLYAWQSLWRDDVEAMQQEVRSMLAEAGFPRRIRRIVVSISGPGRAFGMKNVQHFTYRHTDTGYQEERIYRGVHPMMAKRLHFWRLQDFNIERLPSAEDIYLLHAIAQENPKDERLFVCAEVRDLTPVRDEGGHIVGLPHLERMFTEAVAAMRRFQWHRGPSQRLYWNRILLYVWPPLTLTAEEMKTVIQRLVSTTDGLGLEQVVLRARIPNPQTGELRDMVVRLSSPAGHGVLMTFRPAANLQPLRPLTEYTRNVVRMRQRGMIYPYEIIKLLAPGPEETQSDFPPGDFVEYDLNSEGDLVPVNRPYGENKSNIIAGVIRNFTPKYPEGMVRVVLMGDPSKDLGALAESECRRIIAAFDLAAERNVPMEWFPISAGAKISMDSGVENMEWIARVLRRIVEFTQAGGEVNLVINGINVGAQPYWNAEATMLMHTRGILVMTPKASMVLTGKRALEYSGSISAEDNQGIGGYDRIMGVNGQAQYWAADIDGACQILLRHYEHTYVMPGERFPRRSATTDPVDRDVRSCPHANGREDSFTRVGEIFSDDANPGRKKSFEIRKVMAAVIDQDLEPMERWSGMRGAETAVVWDAHLGGYPVCLIGIESHPVPRLGFIPADGPDQWCAGTLFPLSSKKVARAINAASNNRPVVLLANLSGFDGSPESMRKLQLEYGAEIGRAVVNFKGPMVFCVISRYHGGAYVVFSRVLNEQLEVAALEGTYASVIGGAPAAAVVFAGEVAARTRKDPRLRRIAETIAHADSVDKGRLQKQYDELFKVVHSEKLGEIADEFDRIHSVHRALRVGALHRIIAPDNLRPYLVSSIERGIQRELGFEEVPAEPAEAVEELVAAATV